LCRGALDPVFSGRNPSVWINKHAWDRFITELRALDLERMGEARLASTSPADLAIRVHVYDRAGHIKITGHVASDVIWRDGVDVTRLPFRIELDPSVACVPAPGTDQTNMKHAGVYVRDDAIYVVSSAKDVFGISHHGEWRVKLAQPVSAHELGDAILAALAAYRENIPGATYVRGAKPPPHPFLVFAGFKSWNAFEKGTTYLMVSETDGRAEIVPSTAGSRGGYLHHPERAVHCPLNAEEIGSCLVRQASRSD